jgi:hypothetical protein
VVRERRRQPGEARLTEPASQATPEWLRRSRASAAAQLALSGLGASDHRRVSTGSLIKRTMRGLASSHGGGRNRGTRPPPRKRVLCALPSPTGALFAPTPTARPNCAQRNGAGSAATSFAKTERRRSSSLGLDRGGTRGARVCGQPGSFWLSGQLFRPSSGATRRSCPGGSPGRGDRFPRPGDRRRRATDSSPDQGEAPCRRTLDDDRVPRPLAAAGTTRPSTQASRR